MKYIKIFNNSIDKEIYRKSKFVAPHLFLNKEDLRDVHYLEEYEELEYISSTANGGQYINLGCKLLENTDDIHIDIKFKINSQGKGNSSQSVLFGNQGPSDPWPGFNLRIQHPYLDVFAKWEYTGSVLQNKRYYNSILRNQSENIDNNDIFNISWTLDNIPNNQLSSTLNTCLFCNAIDNNNSAANFINADLYFCRIRKGDLYINLIPVRKKKTNEVGLYDLENNKFYISQGSEPFVAHELPNNIYENKYRKLEYVRSTRYGGEYIDLGSKLMETNEDVQIDIKFEFINKGLESDDQSTLLKFNLEDNNKWPGFVLRRVASTSNVLEFKAKHNFTNSVKTADNKGYRYLFNGTTETLSYARGTIFEESILVDNIPNDQLHSSSVVIFASYDDNNNVYWRYCEAKIYYLKIYKGGVLVHDLIPLLQIEDNIAGLYDRTNGKFYKSNGTNELQAGPSINN